MSEIPQNLHADSLQYAHDEIKRWEAANPPPPKPEPQPAIPDKQLLSINGGFLVLDPAIGKFQIHTLKEGEPHHRQSMPLDVLRDYIFALIEIECALTEYEVWSSDSAVQTRELQEWHNARSLAIETYMKDYISGYREAEALVALQETALDSDDDPINTDTDNNQVLSS